MHGCAAKFAHNSHSLVQLLQFTSAILPQSRVSTCIKCIACFGSKRCKYQEFCSPARLSKDDTNYCNLIHTHTCPADETRFANYMHHHLRTLPRCEAQLVPFVVIVFGTPRASGCFRIVLRVNSSCTGHHKLEIVWEEAWKESFVSWFHPGKNLEFIAGCLGKNTSIFLLASEIRLVRN